MNPWLRKYHLIGLNHALNQDLTDHYWYPFFNPPPHAEHVALFYC